jgi:hypothetical protein
VSNIGVDCPGSQTGSLTEGAIRIAIELTKIKAIRLGCRGWSVLRKVSTQGGPKVMSPASQGEFLLTCKQGL